MRKSGFIVLVMALAVLLWWLTNHRPQQLQELFSPPKQEATRRVRTFAEPMTSVSSATAQRPLRNNTTSRITAGKLLTVELIEPPAQAYGDPQWTESDRVYSEMVETFPGAQYDPVLGHAARELAHLYSVEDGLIPSAALDFLLESSGAADWGVRQSFTATSQEGPDAVRSRIKALLEAEQRDGRPVRIGVGEAYELGASPPRTIGILVARGDLHLRPVPRSVKAGETLRISGVLPAGAKKPTLIAMGPDLVMRDIPVVDAGGRFSADVKVNDETGIMYVEILAELVTGPSPLAQLTIHVNNPIPTEWTGRYPPDESYVQDDDAAEELAYALLDADRARFGLPPLERDTELDQVARSHSKDMRDNGFFGHVSKTTGDVGDRLKAAEVAVGSWGENVARNGSLDAAQAGLLHSLGHRRNILEPRFTHVGIGVVSQTENGRRSWYLTQVFGRKPPVVEIAQARDFVLNEIDQLRAADELDALKEDPELDRVAQRYITDDVVHVKAVLNEAQRLGLTRNGAFASYQVLADLEQFSASDQFADKNHQRIGTAIWQEPLQQGGKLRVLVIVAL